MIFEKRKNAIKAAIFLMALLGLVMSCDNAAASSISATAYKGYLYMTDTVSGKVYTYDPAAHTSSSSSCATTGKNATGAIAFYKGIGYAAVGSGTSEGVYYFDPSAANPAFSKLGVAIAAQYFAFSSSKKAYVSSYDYSGTTSGLYSFDPSSPDSGLRAVAAASGKFLQGLAIGADGFLYAADNGNSSVLKIDTSNDALVATIKTTKRGTTGLLPGRIGLSSVVFVINTGGYDSSYKAQPGSIDFIAAGTADGATAASVAASTADGASIFPACAVQLSNGNLIASGYGVTYLVSFSWSTATVAELKTSSGSSFGSLDIALKDGLVYIPLAVTTDYISYKNHLYVLDSSGAQTSYSPVSVMTSSDGISNIGFYE
jgi:hypothetical protein